MSKPWKHHDTDPDGACLPKCQGCTIDALHARCEFVEGECKELQAQVKAQDEHIAALLDENALVIRQRHELLHRLHDQTATADARGRLLDEHRAACVWKSEADRATAESKRLRSRVRALKGALGDALVFVSDSALEGSLRRAFEDEA